MEKCPVGHFNTILPLGISNDVNETMDKGNKCSKSTKNAVSYVEMVINEDLS